MAATALREQLRDAERGIYPEGAAFIDGELVPIAEARIPILDWGFLRSDCTYDVVHVWNGRFFRLDHHLDRFERSAAGLRLKNPYAREEVVGILMRLMRATGLRQAYVEVILTRGMPPKGTRDPRLCENRFYAFVIPFVWIATEEVRERGIHLHISEVLRIPPQLGRSRDQELPLGRPDEGHVRGSGAGLRHAGARSIRRATSPRGRASTSSPSRTAG